MTDLAKALERARALKFGTVPSGADLSAIDIICDAAERVSQVSVKDVARVFHDALENDDDGDGGAYARAAAAVMALLRGEG